MALLDGGTDAATSLKALLVSPAAVVADIASLQQLILDDQNVAHPIWPGGFAANGVLYIPNRGILYTKPGDYVMVDETTGWPILVSAYAFASGPWAAA